jgi:predicted anti-sigma-YlaC factor YlaD
MQDTKQSEANAGSGVGALWPSCREVSRLQSAARQQPLSLARRIGLRFHLLVCSWCRRYGKQVGFLRSVAHEHAPDETASAPSTLRTDVRERMKRSLQDVR